MPHALLYVLIALLASCTFGAGASAKEAPEKLWSFVAPKAPAVPHVADADWAQHDIDRFILAKLEAADLKPTTDADKYTLLRRATFDLIGLPPTAKELEAFVKDPSPDAFGKAVDRLLASPHFGERWGRHWLDVARFAESTGGGRSLMFPNAWRYRDYVIGAYNADKPFDQFVREQLAGDLLEHASNSQRAEQLTATAFLMLGPHNYEQQDKAYLRMDVIDEQIGTTSKAFLGLSLDCARCHDHKSDPMSIEDYYAMAGIFGSTNMITPGNVSGWTETPLEAPQVMAAYEAHAKKLADLTKENKKLTTQRDKLIGANDQTAAVKLASLAGIVRDSDEAILTGAFKPSSSVKPFVGVDYLHTSSVNASAQWVIAIADTGKYEVRVSYTAHNNRAKRAIATVHSTEGSRTIEFDQTQRPPIDGLFVSLGVFEFADEARVELGLAEESGALIVDAVQLLRVGGKSVV